MTAVPITSRVPLRITNRSGRVTVTGEDRRDVLVEKGADHLTTTPEAIEIECASGAVVLRCPLGTDVFAGVASGAVDLRGSLGDVRVTTASGAITVDTATSVEARTQSGSIRVERCTNECRCRAESGHVRVGVAASVEVAVASGNVEVNATGNATVRAGSSNVTIGLTGPGDVVVEAHSGSVDITVPAGVRPALDVASRSGAVRRDVELGDDGRIRVRTGSGRVTVRTRG